MCRCYMQTLYLACVSLHVQLWPMGMASAGSFIGTSTELLVYPFVLLLSLGDTPAIAVKIVTSLDDLRR